MSKRKIKKWQWLVLVVMVIFAGGLKLYQNHLPTVSIELSQKKLNVLVARTAYEQKKGLGSRESLDPYDGMIFIYSTPVRSVMVMRDMKFSIDIVWFLNGEVVDIAPNLPIEPNASDEELVRYYSRKQANLVLELPAGWTKENNLKIGDKIGLVED
jgi:uncharacterized protein